MFCVACLPEWRLRCAASQTNINMSCGGWLYFWRLSEIWRSEWIIKGHCTLIYIFNYILQNERSNLTLAPDQIRVEILRRIATYKIGGLVKNATFSLISSDFPCAWVQLKNLATTSFHFRAYHGHRARKETDALLTPFWQVNLAWWVWLLFRFYLFYCLYK